jgi:hypothetical protein
MNRNRTNRRGTQSVRQYRRLGTRRGQITAGGRPAARAGQVRILGNVLRRKSIGGRGG